VLESSAWLIRHLSGAAKGRRARRMTASMRAARRHGENVAADMAVSGTAHLRFPGGAAVPST
jgi:hypothetical protein